MTTTQPILCSGSVDLQNWRFKASLVVSQLDAQHYRIDFTVTKMEPSFVCPEEEDPLYLIEDTSDRLAVTSYCETQLAGDTIYLPGYEDFTSPSGDEGKGYHSARAIRGKEDAENYYRKAMAALQALDNLNEDFEETEPADITEEGSAPLLGVNAKIQQVGQEVLISMDAIPHEIRGKGSLWKSNDGKFEICTVSTWAPGPMKLYLQGKDSCDRHRTSFVGSIVYATEEEAEEGATAYTRGLRDLGCIVDTEI